MVAGKLRVQAPANARRPRAVVRRYLTRGIPEQPLLAQRPVPALPPALPPAQGAFPVVKHARLVVSVGGGVRAGGRRRGEVAARLVDGRRGDSPLLERGAAAGADEEVGGGDRDDQEDEAGSQRPVSPYLL